MYTMCKGDTCPLDFVVATSAGKRQRPRHARASADHHNQWCRVSARSRIMTCNFFSLPKAVIFQTVLVGIAESD